MPRNTCDRGVGSSLSKILEEDATAPRCCCASLQGLSVGDFCSQPSVKRPQSTNQRVNQQCEQRELGSDFFSGFPWKMNYFFKSRPYHVIPHGTSRDGGQLWAIGQLYIRKEKVVEDLIGILMVSRGSFKLGFHSRLHWVNFCPSKDPLYLLWFYFL